MEEGDIVKLREDIKDVKKGTEGTIIYAYARGKVFVVEFPNGITETVEGSKLEKI